MSKLRLVQVLLVFFGIVFLFSGFLNGVGELAFAGIVCILCVPIVKLIRFLWRD